MSYLLQPDGYEILNESTALAQKAKPHVESHSP